MSQQNALSVAVASYTEGACAAAYVDNTGQLRVTSNGTPRAELAELLERAAGMLRAADDPSATTLD